MRAAFLAVCLIACGCGSIEIRTRLPPPPPTFPVPPVPPGSTGPAVEYETSGVFPTALHIPRGHLPPPGSCRIWYPALPPGQQPPPGDCGALAARVPLGAWLIGHPTGEPEHVHVSVYDHERPGLVIVIRVFDWASGQFVRDMPGHGAKP